MIQLDNRENVGWRASIHLHGNSPIAMTAFPCSQLSMQASRLLIQRSLGARSDGGRKTLGITADHRA